MFFKYFFLQLIISILLSTYFKMKVYICWSKDNAAKLYNQVHVTLDELWLLEFITIEQIEDEQFKVELNIKEDPALVIEEESINFKDVIFEGIIPEPEEIKGMFLSIIGWWEGSGACGKKEGGSCWSWCGC